MFSAEVSLTRREYDIYRDKRHATFEALSVYTPDTAGQGSDPALTPAQTELRRMVLESVVSPHTRRLYSKALDDLFALSAGRPLTRSLLMEYRVLFVRIPDAFLSR